MIGTTQRSSRRLFVALVPDEKLQERLIAQQACWTWCPSARQTPAANFHLTLFFLGELTTDEEHRLRSWLKFIPLGPFAFSLTRSELLEGSAVLRPASSTALDDLHEKVEAVVAWAGLPVERWGAWQPHVTLARDAADAVPPVAWANIEWNVQAFSLLWSHDGHYHLIESWSLGNA